MNDRRRVIVMTGATNGLGAHALAYLTDSSNSRMIIGARSLAPEALPLDLASLASVRSFADAVTQRLDGTLIDALVLNAGAQYRKPATSVDGFEATFAVNHLAHYLLARLLLPRVAPGGRLVLTTSDTHDPKVVPFAPKVLDTHSLAHPRGGLGAAVRAYSASKLCNMLTARGLAVREEVVSRDIRVIAFNPGLTLGTKLGRNGSQRGMNVSAGKPSRIARATLRFLSNFMSAFYPGTPERAGEVLAQLALGTITPPLGRTYVSLVRGEVTFPDPSELARSAEARDRLWRESAAMLGL